MHLFGEVVLTNEPGFKLDFFNKISGGLNMARRFFIGILVPLFLYAQYWGERPTEKSFEQSELFFNSHYLNPYGIFKFRQVSVGLLDDPFLNLYLNPAHLPKLTNGNLLYLDFRSDRTEMPEVVHYHYFPIVRPMYGVPLHLDPRWITTTRREPQPLFSLGTLLYPLKNSQRLFLGGTFQYLRRQEPYYTAPYRIYIYNPYFDFAGRALMENTNIPVVDRYKAEDEMLTTSTFYSLFLGSRLNQRVSLGISFSGVTHSRGGNYLRLQTDEYGQTNDYDWTSYYARERDLNYRHWDLSGGVNIRAATNLEIGAKIGYLQGKADQFYSRTDTSFYDYSWAETDSGVTHDFSWSQSWRYSISHKTWSHNGHNRYLSLNLRKQIKTGQTLQAYLRYTLQAIDLQNTSTIRDTSRNDHQRQWDTTYYEHHYRSSLRDTRSASGQRTSNWWEGEVSLHWKVTNKSTVLLGFYFWRKNYRIESHEPVTALQSQNWWGENDWHGTYHHFSSKLEEKTLLWEYESLVTSFQIPVILQFRLNSHWSMMLGINRRMDSWDIKEVVTAYFKLRRRVKNNEVKEETNFGERYTQPEKHFTESTTDLFTRFSVQLSPQFGIDLSLEPELDANLRIAQWWLAFRAHL